MAGGACVAGGMHGRGVMCLVGVCVWQGEHAWWRGACMAGGACMPHTPPLHPSRYYEIRSMNGQYASYWNAFLLPPTNVVCEGYIFTGICDSVNRGGMRGSSGGACMVALGGACMVALWGACMVAPGGHAWLLGGHAWLLRGACMVAPGGHAWFLPGGHAWFFPGGHAWFFPGGACVGYEIWSISGRYASYWNAFLLVLIKTH